MNERINILLVDDDPRNLDALEAILEDPGYQLLRAVDANSALRMLLDHDVAAIVLDIKMPGTSGFELAQMIKATRRYREIPILFLTAYLVEDRDVITGYGAGAVDYLTKPLNPQIVRHKVAVFAELFRKTRALAELNATLEERVKERTAALEKSEAAAQEAVRLRDEFLSIAAHELRTPLTSLQLQVHSLDNRSDLDAKLAARLRRARRSCDRVTALVEMLLDVSRIGSGNLTLQRESFDLVAALREITERLGEEARAAGCSVTFDAVGPVVGTWDRLRLEQVLTNLLSNAIKYAPNHPIVIGLRSLDGHAVLSVTDRGPGIGPSDLPRIFQRFARAAPVEHYGGLGLGLYITKQIVEAHDGTIDVVSKLGEGTTFTVRLPLHEVSKPPSGSETTS